MNILIISKKNTNQYNSLLHSLNNLNLITVTSYQNNLLEKYNFDILIIEKNILENINNLELIQLYEKTHFILILTTTPQKKKSVYEKMIYCTENNLVDCLMNIIKQLTNNSNEIEIKNKIKKELNFIGYNASYVGTKYLIECIYLLYTNKSYNNFIKNTYPTIAKKYNKTINNIKCNISRATSIMFSESEEEKLKKYLNLQYIPKTAFKIIIQVVLSKI